MLPHALRQSLRSCTKLPSLPTVVLRVIELARDPDASTKEIAATIGNDPALSVRLLSLANTVFYAQHRPAEDLQQAVNCIGIERTLSLALGCSLVSATGTQATAGLNLERYWQRSLICALSAKLLADSLDLHGEGGALFTASLLQDIGMLAMHAADPERYQVLLDEAMDHRALVSLEKRTYDADHAEVGAWLARQWQLSERTSRWICHSHVPMERAVSREQQATNCIVASGLLADAWLDGEASLSAAMASFDEYFGLETPEMIAKVMAIQEHLPGVARLYDIALPERLDANHLMFEAKLLLAERNARLQQDLLRQQREIETLRQKQEALSLQARVDPLTKLYNRLHLEETLGALFDDACRTHQPLAVIFIDLDRFKEINDRFGHGVGDAVLKDFAKILRHRVDESGLYAGRYGGEEFVILLPGYDAAGAKAFAKRIRESIAATPFGSVQNVSLYITASYGIAAVEGDSGFRDVEALLHAADKSMYDSKFAGCDRITVFSSDFYISRS